jgi:hypothetical protein
MGTRNRSEIAAVRGTLCMIPPRNSDQYSFIKFLVTAHEPTFEERRLVWNVEDYEM